MSLVGNSASNSRLETLVKVRTRFELLLCIYITFTLLLFYNRNYVMIVI